MRLSSSACCCQALLSGWSWTLLHSGARVSEERAVYSGPWRCDARGIADRVGERLRRVVIDFVHLLGLAGVAFNY